MKYQKFFCPQCGHGIKSFDVEVGDTGYHMQATCPKCKVHVQGVADMPMIITTDVGLA